VVRVGLAAEVPEALDDAELPGGNDVGTDSDRVPVADGSEPEYTGLAEEPSVGSEPVG
jgi:hypothetical protein